MPKLKEKRKFAEATAEATSSISEVAASGPANRKIAEAMWKLLGLIRAVAEAKR
jgi:hypothetical protein